MELRQLATFIRVAQFKMCIRDRLCIPVLGIGAILGIGNATGLIDYTVIWRYFSWTNQTLAMIVPVSYTHLYRKLLLECKTQGWYSVQRRQDRIL